ncbi:MAG TPA: glycosyltransferase family 39 protein, partial [Ignavibacteria bacterium]
MITSLVAFKLLFQFLLLASGLKWLTADDYSRTVISWDWLQNPRIYSGVWLSLHFWINGFFIWLFKDLSFAPLIANTLFSVMTLLFIYLMFKKIFGKAIAVISSLIYCVFPFQVWLSVSGMPESIFFFFITAAVYFFTRWYEQSASVNTPRIFLFFSAAALNAANLLRYEGWFFTLAFIILAAVLTYRKFDLGKVFFVNTGIALLSYLSALWWLYQNYADYGNAFFFIHETSRIFSGLNNAGYLQRFIQYPFFIFYIAPLTTALGLWKIICTIRNKPGTFTGNFSLLKIFLLFNLLELLILMVSGIVGSGGTNMISRYIVLNAIFFFPFAIWQLFDFRKYVLIGSSAVLITVNIIWSFYYQPAYREDTYEVGNLTRKLIEKKYFEPDDKIYFEPDQGYFDIYPLQVISNNPGIFTSDTIPTYFTTELPASKKSLKKKRDEDQLKLNILELRKYIEQKKIKLFIVRSDLLIDKLKKLSYKSEQIGDYHIFYISENKIKYKRGEGSHDSLPVSTNGRKPGNNEISFDKRLILKEFAIDNSNFGMNPQTITLKWQIADVSFLDSLASDEDDFGRYKIKLGLSPVDADTIAYDTYSNVFSERNVEEFFETEEIKNIMILKPFALL